MMMPVNGTLVERVADGLREAIITGRLEAGQRIPQEDMAAEYGTSRLPVREALRLLASEGLVVLVPNVGARVASFDINELNEVYEIRERLESFAIARSAPFLTDEQLDEITELAREMEAAAETRPLHVWLELDERFHFATFAGQRQPRLIPIVESLWNRTGQYRRAYTSVPQRLDLAHLEHRLLVDALERRDPLDAERILQTHIRRTRLTLLANHDGPMQP